MGWRKEVTTDLPTKGIICLAPHTSNWDFIIGLLYSRAEGIWSNFLMKREWFFWPIVPSSAIWVAFPFGATAVPPSPTALPSPPASPTGL